MNVEIDPESGFCFGVVYAIRKAEKELDTTGNLFCLGDIVHNNVEVARLASKGLITINHEQFRNLNNCKVLIRAHGEPPETYQIASKNNITILEASCPVVLKLQKRIKTAFNKHKRQGGQIVIYGKEGHAEVNGLVGQTDGSAKVINNLEDLYKIDFSRPVILFSQTTMSIDGYERIKNAIKERMLDFYKNDVLPLIVNDTICKQVSERDRQLKIFAGKFDVIIFVSGRKSSNGKMLYEVCKQVNPRAYFVSDIQDINTGWLKGAKSAGICGATSTPRWLMEKIANEIRIN